jgi:Trk-type K+ transport system membrane component
MATADDDSSFDAASAASPANRWLRLFLDPTSPAVTVCGLVMVVAGFVLIGLGWYDVSGTANVAFQMPYLVSSGLTGLGLIVIGTATVAIAIKRQDADQRIRKLEQLAMALRVDEPGADEPGADEAKASAGLSGGQRRRSRREVLRDPAVRATVVFFALAVSGIVALILAWWGVSGTYDVSNQVAYTVSGGLGGLALAVAGSGLLFTHLGRWASAREDAALDRVIGATAEFTRQRELRPRRVRRKPAAAPSTSA